MATAVKKRAAAGSLPTHDVLRVHAAVEHYLPKVKDLVRSYEVEFREDHAGEPAVYVTLRSMKSGEATPAELKRLVLFWQRVAREILEKDATYFPYLTLAGAAKR